MLSIKALTPLGRHVASFRGLANYHTQYPKLNVKNGRHVMQQYIMTKTREKTKDNVKITEIDSDFVLFRHKISKTTWLICLRNR